jgi:probable F420-dependent oxidoreductase
VKPTLSGVGIWSSELRFGDQAAIPSAAAELESLGYSALWVPDVGGPLFESLDILLDATSTITVATGVLNVWTHSPEEVVSWWTELPEDRAARVLLGLGVSHGAVVGETWGRPIATMNTFLDALEAQGLPLERVCLAALGPKMLELAARRTAGAHPYFVPVEHTAVAREALGDALLCVEQAVIIDPDAAAARELARQLIEGYGKLPNYANNWKRFGLTDDDVATGSDRIIDALIAVGDEADVQTRVLAHQAAGADHVCLQVATAPGGTLPLEEWRRLAPGI